MRVFIADDSVVIRNIVKEILAQQKGFEVVGEAANGQLALSRVLELQPDIVIMDMDMPVMNGLEATCRITRSSSIPVLMFSNNADPELPFRALERGAADFLRKPDFNDINKPEYIRKFVDLLASISARYKGRIFFSYRQSTDDCVASAAHQPPPSTSRQTDVASRLSAGPGAGVAGQPQPVPRQNHQSIRVIVDAGDINIPPDLSLLRPGMAVLGASTGGPQAVLRFLTDLGAPLPIPLLVVQHIETGFDRGYAEWLSEESRQLVRLVMDGEVPKAGVVYIAPTDIHLRCEYGRLRLDDGPKVLNQKPSVDVLFNSACESYGSRVLAILMTGMGTDGAAGCLAIKKQGGCTLVQDEATSLIYGMPKAAVDCDAASYIVPLPLISKYVRAATGLSV
ncbi:MAG: chemotaxis-specific protein-glutamate methyltransferase CheB [Spirochaetes bacterium]|nr:chemotaxis-specific protein-glutamate methyltransferase CheB [Spirochaetota bacterium]